MPQEHITTKGNTLFLNLNQSGALVSSIRKTFKSSLEKNYVTDNFQKLPHFE